MKVSYQDLQNYTGMTYQTIKKRLLQAGLKSVGYGDGPGKAILWESKEALPALYLPLVCDGLDPQQEKARLDRLKADHQEIVNSEKRGELLNVVENNRFWTTCIVAWRTKLQGVPSKLAALINEDDREECFKLLQKAINELLTEMANVDPGREEVFDADSVENR